MESAAGAVVQLSGTALEVRSQCVFQRPMTCDAWIRELRLIGVRAGVASVWKPRKQLSRIRQAEHSR